MGKYKFHTRSQRATNVEQLDSIDIDSVAAVEEIVMEPMSEEVDEVAPAGFTQELKKRFIEEAWFGHCIAMSYTWVSHCH